MDDILISHPIDSKFLLILAELTKELQAWGLCIAPEKVPKQMPPFQYFGQVINGGLTILKT
jgi:hypothetical protein